MKRAEGYHPKWHKEMASMRRQESLRETGIFKRLSGLLREVEIRRAV